MKGSRLRMIKCACYSVIILKKYIVSSPSPKRPKSKLYSLINSRPRHAVPTKEVRQNGEKNEKVI